MLSFCIKICLIGSLLGEIGLFRVYSVYAEQRFFCELGKKKKIFFYAQVSSKYFLIIDFPKFKPLTATEFFFLSENFTKWQNLFSLC